MELQSSRREWVRAGAIVVVVVESRVCRCGEDREYGNDRRWRGMKSV